MNKTTAIILGVLAVVFIGGMFAYSYYTKNAAGNNPAVVPPVEEEHEEVRIDGVHVYRDGSHTVIGEVMMPTACHLLESETIVAESMPEQITISLSTIPPAENTVCAQVITPQRFRVDVDASEGATFRATLDGRPAVLNLREGDPSTELDINGEFFFKG